MQRSNNLKIIVLIILLSLPTFLDSCRRNGESRFRDVDKLRPEHVTNLERIRQKGILRVVTEYNSISYFIYRGQPMGFQYEMLQELANLEHFSHVYADSGIRFPVPYQEYSSETALVMSFEEGVRFDDVEAVARLDVPFRELMQRLVLFYTEQMLVKGFFHADPHPGNLLVTPAGELILLDFGMSGEISQAMREGLNDILEAFVRRDYRTILDRPHLLQVRFKDLLGFIVCMADIAASHRFLPTDITDVRHFFAPPKLF